MFGESESGLEYLGGKNCFGAGATLVSEEVLERTLFGGHTVSCQSLCAGEGDVRPAHTGLDGSVQDRRQYGTAWSW